MVKEKAVSGRSCRGREKEGGKQVKGIQGGGREDCEGAGDRDG